MNSILKKTVLVLAANPRGTNRLRLDEEVRQIKEALRRSPYRDDFVVVSELAVRPDDVRRALLQFRPQIVHFCGHGTGEEGLVMVDDVETVLIDGSSRVTATNTRFVPGEALANLFKRFKQQLDCVVLNACYSEAQADAINQHINYVIGMKQEVVDAAAIKFAVGFYDALGAGESTESAYDLGCNAIELYKLPGHLTPVLKKNTVNQRSAVPTAN